LAQLEETQNLDLALTCEQTWQCSPQATDLWQAVNCSDEGRCRCNSELGFSGGGNQTHPCTCASPRVIVWSDCVAYCVDISGLIVLQPTPVLVPVAPPVEPTPVPVVVPVMAPVPIPQPEPTLRPVAIPAAPPIRRPLHRVPILQPPVQTQGPTQVVVVLPPPSDNDDGNGNAPVNTVILPSNNPQNVVVRGNSDSNNPGASVQLGVDDGGNVVVGAGAGSAQAGVSVDDGNVQLRGNT